MKDFNICDYGARICDQPQTKEIQAAIDACFLAGGGRVIVPAGIYNTAVIRIRSNVTLYLESGAMLKGIRDPEAYFAYREDQIEPVTVEDYNGNCASTISTSRWSNGLIRALNAENIAVIGEKGSFIDGNNCYDPNGENHYRGPHGMSFWRCKNIHLEGYTFTNSSNWCHAIFRSQNITIRNISIIGGCDGIDIRTCDNILIEDCTINSGDDCVAGFDNHDVVVRNCTLNTACMPLRLGGNNILVENCISDNRGFGSRLRLSLEEKQQGVLSNEKCRHESHTAFAYYCDHRAKLRKPAENIVIRGCHFAQENELMRLEFTGLHRWCCNRSLRSITFEDCSFAGLTISGMLWGDAGEKVTCLFKNCKISAKPGKGIKPLLVAGNFKKLTFENCTIEGYAEPTILLGTDDPVEIIHSTPITLKKATFAECIKAHSQGIASEDWAAMQAGDGTYWRDEAILNRCAAASGQALYELIDSWKAT